jgi:tripartite-type tricarboxylate transporter receptor subunit TctC
VKETKVEKLIRLARRWLLPLAAMVAAGAIGTAAVAQQFPAKPVELTVLFPAGSSADVVARLLADGMSRQLGQPVTVMNRPGAGGAIAYKHVHGQKPDGYSIVFNSNSISTLHYSGLVPFDYKAFEPVARVTVEMPVIAVRADAPWRNLKELTAYAQGKPGALRLGNSGIGSHTHTTAVAFFNDQSVEVTHVAFAGGAVITSLLGGHIEAVVQLPGALAPHVKAGTLRVLATLASQREPAFPDVPTAMEQGYSFHADMWRGIAVPKGTPRPVIARLEAAIQQAISSPEFKTQGDKLGFLPAFQPAAEFGQTIASEDKVLSKVMDKAGLKKSQP